MKWDAFQLREKKKKGDINISKNTVNNIDTASMFNCELGEMVRQLVSSRLRQKQTELLRVRPIRRLCLPFRRITRSCRSSIPGTGKICVSIWGYPGLTGKCSIAYGIIMRTRRECGCAGCRTQMEDKLWQCFVGGGVGGTYGRNVVGKVPRGNASGT